MVSPGETVKYWKQSLASVNNNILKIKWNQKNVNKKSSNQL